MYKDKWELGDFVSLRCFRRGDDFIIKKGMIVKEEQLVYTSNTNLYFVLCFDGSIEKERGIYLHPLDLEFEE